ncbi:4'-phosphopantetheinyl transferase family protein [Litoreibacter halocynthiae]|nr:4'-phosphopantetheinyl transferase superfamily protein [Litoreibacter halocynthiae]
MTEKIRSTLREMLGDEVGIGITDPRDPEQGLLEAEYPAIASAVPKRRREYAAGRRAARAAMTELGLPPAPILTGTQREPLWPHGLVGSIAHCNTLCIAAVSLTHRSIGLDVEPAVPLPSDLERIVCTPTERHWLKTLPINDRGLNARKIFSAKEAVYKAQYLVTSQMIGFEDVNIQFEGVDFTADLPSTLTIQSMSGQLRLVEDYLLGSVRIDM